MPFVWFLDTFKSISQAHKLRAYMVRLALWHVCMITCCII